MLLRGKSKDRSSPRKVTPPLPSYMNSGQFASYLAGLRDSRANRPGGARPQPPSTKSHQDSSDRFTTGRPSLGGRSVQSETSTSHHITNSDTAKPRSSRPSIAGSVASRYSTNTIASGRDYYPARSAASPLKPSEVVPSATYIERGQRWMEKEEAFSLHHAMDAMGIKDDDKDNKDKVADGQEDEDDSRLYNAALNEASELVWQHQHGVEPREPGAPYQYKPHMRKDSYAHARTASAGRYGNDIGATGLARDSIRSFSGSSSGSDGASPTASARGSMEQQQRNSSAGSGKSKSYAGISGGVRVSSGGRRRSSMKRNISGEIKRPFSGDQIWEEPESSTPELNARQPRKPGPPQPLSSLKTKNAPSKVEFAVEPASEPTTSPITAPTQPLSRFDIHKNPPSQSRNPTYTSNSPFNRPRPSKDVPTKHGMEIRGDDIRQATSMRIRDRSPKLPTPSAVSDSPGRPIVSFEKHWKAPEEATDPEPEESRRVPPRVKQERTGQAPQSPIPTFTFTPDVPSPAPSSRSSRTPAIPSIQIDGDDGPQVPVIAVSDHSPAIPTIVLPGDDSNSNENNMPNIPIIVTPDDDEQPSVRPLPTPNIPVIVTPDGNNNPSARPLPDPKSVQPSHLRNARGGRPQGHWSPAPGASRRATATCHECRLPIEGRFVALGGASERFHPQCFSCYACGTGLEALEISPEPDSFRSERLDRIRRRAAGEVLDEQPGQTMAEDGDERLRFYCHLDWHELFAPRCKHCKTPILGEHVVALGAHWHYGHFFCAECGDPFERGTTHIEKDGYAWCVGCQTRRTERRAPKCKACRVAVIGQYVVALGGEWHDECFRCAGCRGGFDDGQIFPVEDYQGRGLSVVLCTGCRAAELKM
ncbi:Uu.00g015770.m01.CDS01 [Anthostomella pinea]|uniref:Uu.00g015770.m01.CDS01 n=1 Tax=Anthostomella pinea TaxID=933095 RepID=A0AAI8YQE5_9PEZI|nr:Uu.00g015770.m01.CDS01 [Anthostomella pinea]